jgi:hypothetical protein
MERRHVLDWLRHHPDGVHGAPEEVLTRCDEEVHEHASEDAWLAAKAIAADRERYWHDAWGAPASEAFVAREVCRELAGALRRSEPTPAEGQAAHFVDDDVLGALEPEARALLLRYVHDLARVEEHHAWRQVVQFTRAFGTALVRGGGFSQATDFEHARLYAATAERVMHRLVEEYERHAHPRVG